jgi:uncharacterized protein (DUF2147 family)
MKAAPCPPERALFLDWLRIAALGALIVYHVAAYYARWPWHVNSPMNALTGPVIEPLMRLSSPWRMSLLFLVSGAATAFMLARRPASGGWLRERARRLLLPLLLGALLIVAPQSWLEVRERFGYAGSFADFLGLYWTADGRFVDGRGKLILPTWNHLWFLPYLFTYTAVLWAWQRWQPRGLDAAAAALPQALRGWRLAVWPLLVPALSLLLLAAGFGRSHALVDDPSSHVLYASAFFFGVLLARSGRLWPRLDSWRWPALGIAFAAWAVFAAAGRSWLGGAAAVLQTWAALVAVIGFAFRHWNLDHPWRAALSEAVFPVYLVHQTVIIVAAVALRPLGWAPLAEAAFLIGSTLLAGAAFYLAVRPWRRLRPWVGLGALALAAAAVPTRAQSVAEMAGEWWTPGFASRVRLAPCAEAPTRLCGLIVWLWDERATVADGKPLLGRRVVDGDRLHNPEDGRSYAGRLRLVSAHQLEVEGCVLMICKRQVWRRYDAQRVPPVAP